MRLATCHSPSGHYSSFELEAGDMLRLGSGHELPHLVFMPEGMGGTGSGVRSMVQWYEGAEYTRT